MISMMNDNSKDTFVSVSMELLHKYHQYGDKCLVNIKRELTKCLIEYTCFNALQNINNLFFDIINNLTENNYTTVYEMEKDKNSLVSAINIFCKKIRPNVSDGIFTNIYRSCQELSIMVNKLYTILKDLNKR